MAQLLGTSAGDVDTSEDAPPAGEEPTPIEERAAESLPDWLSGWEEEDASSRQGAYPTPEQVGDEATPESETAQQGEGIEQDLPDWLYFAGGIRPSWRWSDFADMGAGFDPTYGAFWYQHDLGYNNGRFVNPPSDPPPAGARRRGRPEAPVGGC